MCRGTTPKKGRNSARARKQATRCPLHPKDGRLRAGWRAGHQVRAVDPRGPLPPRIPNLHGMLSSRLNTVSRQAQSAGIRRRDGGRGGLAGAGRPADDRYCVRHSVFLARSQGLSLSVCHRTKMPWLRANLLSFKYNRGGRLHTAGAIVWDPRAGRRWREL